MTAPNLSRERAFAAEVLVDHCTIYGDDMGAPVFDEDEGRVVYPVDDVVWSGPCSVSANLGMAAGNLVRSDDLLTESDYVVRVPLDVVGVKPGQVVTIDQVHVGGDRDLLNLDLTIDTVGRRSHAVLRRLRCSLRQPTPAT